MVSLVYNWGMLQLHVNFIFRFRKCVGFRYCWHLLAIEHGHGVCVVQSLVFCRWKEKKTPQPFSTGWKATLYHTQKGTNCTPVSGGVTQNPLLTQEEFCRTHPLDQTCLSRWIAAKEALFVKAADCEKRKFFSTARSHADCVNFPLMEERLFQLFKHRRSEGRRCCPTW